MRFMKKAAAFTMAVMLAVPSVTAMATEGVQPYGGFYDNNGEHEWVPDDDEIPSPVILEKQHDTTTDPYIITEEIRPAVKYIPYSAMIRNSNRDNGIVAYYTLKQGTLPEGVELRQNGELYGAPREAGSFTFTVDALFQNTRNGVKSQAKEKTLTLTVNENSNENVYYESDIEEGYILSTPIGAETSPGSHDFYLESPADSLFVSEGSFDNFADLWLNGERLRRNVDYTVEAGSTRITVIAQTMQNIAHQSGNNTIVAEFRVNGDIDRNLRITAQNFHMVNSGQTSGGSGNNSAGGGSGNGGSANSGNSAAAVAVATGDPLNFAGWISLTLLSIAALAGVLFFGKKRDGFFIR